MEVTKRKYPASRAGFTMAEAIVAVVIMVIFFVGVLSFFGFQNKNLKRFDTERQTLGLMDEAEAFLRSAKFDDLPQGIHALSFVTETFTWTTMLAEFELRPTSADPEDRTYGKYVDARSVAVDRDAEGTEAYMRTIEIKDAVFPFPSSKIKAATIRIWSPECGYFGDPCATRSFHLIEKHAY